MSTESLAEDLERAKQRILDLIDEREQLEAEGELAFWQKQHFENLINHAVAEEADIEAALADRGVEVPEVVPVTTEATPVVVTQVAGDDSPYGHTELDPEGGDDE